MKKFLKSKFQDFCIETSNSAMDAANILENQTEINSVGKPTVPHSSTSLDSTSQGAVRKEEILNVEENGNPSTAADEILDQHNAIDTKSVSIEVSDENKKPIMCKRFVRGTCTKGDACIFKHEIIPKQMYGIYKFCWDYQNNICSIKRQNCGLVHATVSEEQNFYRTGYLPLHAFQHINSRSDTLQPSLPTIEESTIHYKFPPPQISSDSTSAKEVVQTDIEFQTSFVSRQNSGSSSGIDEPAMHYRFSPPLLSPQPSKSITSDIEESRMLYKFSPPERSEFTPPDTQANATEYNASFIRGRPSKRKSSEIGGNNSIKKRCEKCEDSILRLQFNTAKYREMLISRELFEEKIAALKRKNEKLNQLLSLLLKNNNTSASDHSNSNGESS